MTEQEWLMADDSSHIDGGYSMIEGTGGGGAITDKSGIKQ